MAKMMRKTYDDIEIKTSSKKEYIRQKSVTLDDLWELSLFGRPPTVPSIDAIRKEIREMTHGNHDDEEND